MNKLYRSRRDRWISGLLGGLGEYLGVSSWVLRLLMLISIPITGGTTVFIYFIAALVVSKEPYAPYDPYYNGGWPGGGSDRLTAPDVPMILEIRVSMTVLPMAEETEAPTATGRRSTVRERRGRAFRPAGRPTWIR